MPTGSISLDILLNKILTDAISGGNESIRAIQKRYPSLSEKEAHEILAMVSATAQSNDAVSYTHLASFWQMRLVWAKQSKLGWCLIMFWTTEQKKY